MKATEFGGSPQKNRIQPPLTPEGRPGHVPTPSELLLLSYTTGQTEDSTVPPDMHEAFEGLLPIEEQRALREAEGVLEKGVDEIPEIV